MAVGVTFTLLICDLGAIWVDTKNGMFSTVTLPDDHREIILLLVATIHDVFKKHLLPHVSRSDGFTSSTKRIGETVFRYMRAAFNRNQNTRMVLIAAQFIGKRSKYVANVIEDPTLMEECMTRVSTHLTSKEVRCMTYCRLRLEHLLEENGRKLAAAKSKEKDGKILARLLNASLVPKDTSSITVDVLKGANKLLRRRQPEVADFLRLSVNWDQLLAQLEEWVEDAVVM